MILRDDYPSRNAHVHATLATARTGSKLMLCLLGLESSKNRGLPFQPAKQRRGVSGGPSQGPTSLPARGDRPDLDQMRLAFQRLADSGLEFRHLGHPLGVCGLAFGFDFARRELEAEPIG